MGRLKTVCFVTYVVICYFHVQGVDKYTDENRPYEFGFSIDGEQHRHEKKDENGIIMGEFGFITADGVYHVTVYATDENGNFKIISMKNIRVKPYPTTPQNGERKGHSLSLTSPQQTSTPQIPAKIPKIKTASSVETLKSCSHCKVPTTTTTTTFRPQQFTKQSTQTNSGQNYQQESISNLSQQNYPNPDQSYPNQAIKAINQDQYINTEASQHPQDDFNVGRKYLQKAKTQQNYQQTSNLQSNSLVQSNKGLQQQGIIDGQYNLEPPHENQQDLKIANLAQTYPQKADANIQDFGAPTLTPKYTSSMKKSYNVQKSNLNSNNYVQNEPKTYSKPSVSSVQGPGERQPKTFMNILQTVNPAEHESSPENIGKPILVAAQMQVVDKNTKIYNKNPGENEGLPKGLTKGDMTELLYTFNYTVGFHGHHEEGYRNGAKVGYYFVTARSGVRTRVDYVADETGYHPRISQEILDIQSDEVPKPETEKDEKYGLKGYEFKWLYYPVESK